MRALIRMIEVLEATLGWLGWLGVATGVVLLLSTCASPHFTGVPYWRRSNIPIRVASEPDVADATETAIAGWNQEVGCHVFAAAAWSDVAAVRVVGVSGEQGPLAGLTHCSEGNCLVTFFPVTKTSFQIASWVAYHELGHVLGLAHDAARSSIMYDTVPGDYLSTSHWGDKTWIPHETALAVRRWYCN